jgi:hypothetical protein
VEYLRSWAFSLGNIKFSGDLPDKSFAFTSAPRSYDSRATPKPLSSESFVARATLCRGPFPRSVIASTLVPWSRSSLVVARSQRPQRRKQHVTVSDGPCVERSHPRRAPVIAVQHGHSLLGFGIRTYCASLCERGPAFTFAPLSKSKCTISSLP